MVLTAVGVAVSFRIAIGVAVELATPINRHRLENIWMKRADMRKRSDLPYELRERNRLRSKVARSQDGAPAFTSGRRTRVRPHGADNEEEQMP